MSSIAEGQRAANDRDRLPRHIAIVMDGNGRWAKARGVARHTGHQAGAENLRNIVKHCADLGVQVLTVFAFSSENWRRPKAEVALLMQLFMDALKRETPHLCQHNVSLRIIGDRSAFSERLQRRMEETEALTADCHGMVLQVAANYGGRWDVAQAAGKLAFKVVTGDLAVEQLDEAALAAELSFAGLPDPDLFIRTGGEQRLSNFVLWQSAYAELYFSDLYWPDFNEEALDQALADYAGRQRRYGMTPDQVTQPGEEGSPC